MEEDFSFKKKIYYYLFNKNNLILKKEEILNFLICKIFFIKSF
jgi:hypothetical protein